jgi:hypothetical protein
VWIIFYCGKIYAALFSDELILLVISIDNLGTTVDGLLGFDLNITTLEHKNGTQSILCSGVWTAQLCADLFVNHNFLFVN